MHLTPVSRAESVSSAWRLTVHGRPRRETSRRVGRHADTARALTSPPRMPVILRTAGLLVAVERLHDVRLVRPPQEPERPAVVRRRGHQLGDRPVRVPAPGAGQPDRLQRARRSASSRSCRRRSRSSCSSRSRWSTCASRSASIFCGRRCACAARCISCSAGSRRAAVGAPTRSRQARAAGAARCPRLRALQHVRDRRAQFAQRALVLAQQRRRRGGVGAQALAAQADVVETKQPDGALRVVGELRNERDPAGAPRLLERQREPLLEHHLLQRAREREMHRAVVMHVPDLPSVQPELDAVVRIVATWDSGAGGSARPASVAPPSSPAARTLRGRLRSSCVSSEVVVIRSTGSGDALPHELTHERRAAGSCHRCKGILHSNHSSHRRGSCVSQSYVSRVRDRTRARAARCTTRRARAVDRAGRVRPTSSCAD